MDWKIDLPEHDIDENMVQCSFCNSSQVPKEQAFTNSDDAEASKDVVFICHDCVRLGAAQLGDPSEPGEELGDLRTCNFCQRQQEFAEQIFAGGDKTRYVCTDCLTSFASRIPAA